MDSVGEKIIQSFEEFTDDLIHGTLDHYRKWKVMIDGDMVVRIGPNGERQEFPCPKEFQGLENGPSQV